MAKHAAVPSTSDRKLLSTPTPPRAAGSAIAIATATANRGHERAVTARRRSERRGASRGAVHSGLRGRGTPTTPSCGAARATGGEEAGGPEQKNCEHHAERHEQLHAG